MKLGIQQLERRALDAESEPEELKNRIVAMSSTLQGQIDLLSRIAGEFSTLARLPQGELLPLSLKCLLEEVVLLHGVEGVGPTLSCDGDVEVQGDADQLKRLFSNLIINAQQAIGDGPGEVWVVLDASVRCVLVKDSGPGMSKEVAERVFEPRFTTRGGGSGLGLAMVKAIAERHSWRVVFDSKPGLGTEFRLFVKG
jgi:signal transduction histidine kinase